MNRSCLCLAWLISMMIGIWPASFLEAAFRANSYVDKEQAVAWNEMRDLLDTLRHQVENQESDLNTYEQKIENLYLVLESLKEQVESSVSFNKEQLKGRSATMGSKIDILETASKNLTADFKKFQTHANETSSSLESFKKKMTEWEQKFKLQNQAIENLQSTVLTLMEALQLKVEGASSWSGKTHKVKNGDSLEKIARSYSTNVRSIMELNALTNSDKIMIGQTLKIPNL